MYGWQLAEQLQRVGLISSIGTLYPTLTRLRERGAIRATESRQGVGPVRKYYALTAEGEAELEHFRNDWTQFAHQVSVILAKEQP
jgi:PadR family transcriptional regulator PadR